MTRIVFMGSPDFALPTLRALAAQYSVIGVISQPDRQSGRGRRITPPAVKTLAEELSLPVMQPERLRSPAAMAQLQAWQPTLIVVAAYGQILRSEVLDLPHYGCINVHASLLPRWRGAAPIQAALLHGDSETGITIMRMDAGVDTGPILSQQATPIRESEDAITLSARLAEMGARLLLEVLPTYLRGELQPQPQDEPSATYAPMLKKEDGLLDFNQPAAALAWRVRAFNPWPGAYTTWQGGQLKIIRAHGVSTQSAPIGQQVIYLRQPAIGTSRGLLVLEEVQPAGKKPLPGKEFLHGAKAWGSTRIE